MAFERLICPAMDFFFPLSKRICNVAAIHFLLRQNKRNQVHTKWEKSK